MTDTLSTTPAPLVTRAALEAFTQRQRSHDTVLAMLETCKADFPLDLHLRRPEEIGPRYRSDQHTRIEKKAGTAQGIRNSSAQGASNSAWVCIFPSSPPGCRGAEAVRETDDCMAASSAPTWQCSSGDRRSSCCCRDGLMEVMGAYACTNIDPRQDEQMGLG
ncbi:MAG: hypothetical protein KFB97_02925 [Cyanobium sp. M30B3]|nr:MAG: hypothetical protein KFB97_02925 [Cyanobium sp. M30B3]